MVGEGRVAVVGGSLGGLTAALLLRGLGFDVTVYERSGAELEQRGAGIGFLPASARYLVERARLDLDRISVSTGAIRYLGARPAGARPEPARPHETDRPALPGRLQLDTGRSRADLRSP